jgi:hypothetical protein
MSHPLWYTRRMIIETDMKEKENTNELTFGGWHSDEKETFTGVRNDSHGNDCRDHDQDAWNYEIDETDCWK